MKFVVIAMMVIWAGTSAYSEPANPQVSHLSVIQRTDGSGKVDIRYDVANTDSQRLWVGVAVSKNGGDWYGVTPNGATLKGDFGEHIKPGQGKHIVWDAPQDVPGVEGDTFRVQLSASDWPSAKGARSTVWGTFLYNRVQTGCKNFIDGKSFLTVDVNNTVRNQQYRPIGPDGEPVFRSEDYMDLIGRQPCGATREWWTHGLRQMVDIGYQTVVYTSFGTHGDLELCSCCDRPNDPACRAKVKNNPFHPDFAAKAFGKVFDEMGFPLKVAFFCDAPGAHAAYNGKRLREHYGEWEGRKYTWRQNGEDPDGIITQMPLTRENVREQFYENMIKPFYSNFNRPQDRARWQTHNDLPMDQGGRPMIWIYAGGKQWFTKFEKAADSFAYVKELFEQDFGVEPFITMSDYWFKDTGLTGEPLQRLNEIVDSKHRYIGEWIWYDTNSPGPNSWEFKHYRITRISPGMKYPPGRFRPVIDKINGKRWRYVDGTEGDTETYFLDREWAKGMTDGGFTRKPDIVIIGHFDEYTEGEMTGLMADYEAKDGGVLPPDYYMDAVRQRIKAYGAYDPAHKTVVESECFVLDTTGK